MAEMDNLATKQQLSEVNMEGQGNEGRLLAEGNSRGGSSSDDARSPIDIQELMQQIRQRVKEDSKTLNLKAPHRKPHQVSQESSKTSPLLYREELNYLNAHWHDWSGAWEVTSHRPVVGRFITKMKRFFLGVVWKYLLKDYMERERQFHMNLVRHLNETAKYIDTRDSEIFWQLVNKIDVDIENSGNRIDRIVDEVRAALVGMQMEIEQSGAKQSQFMSEGLGRIENLTFKTAEAHDLIRGIERTLALLDVHSVKQSPDSQEENIDEGDTVSPELSEDFPEGRGVLNYLLLENRYRGTEELIKARQADYLGYYLQAKSKVVEIGCGRGEFLELLRENGVDAVGVDLDTAMIARCREKNLEVVHQDALSYLGKLPAGSIGGVFAAQLVEHLDRESLETLISLCFRAVQPGGVVIFETINPQSFAALARNFFRDPTHVWPLHPDTLRYMMELKGFDTKDVLMKSPYPEEAVLRPIHTVGPVPARWEHLVRQVNDNIDRLNDCLFGYQDYAVVGVVPAN